MKMINRIMAAIDFSDYSVSLAQYAADLARDIGAGLILVNVLNKRDVDLMDRVHIVHPDFPKQKYLDENLEYRRKRLGEMAQKIQGDGPEVKTQVLIDVPFEGLLKAIEANKPELLVIGTKGRSNLMDTIIGSCAQKMFRRSPIPVLCLPWPEDQQ